MRFYDQQHEFYCGVDLHTRKMYLCVLDREGNKQLHRNMRAKPEDFLQAIKPFRDGLVVGVATNLRSVPDVHLVPAGQAVAIRRGCRRIARLRIRNAGRQEC